MYLLVSPFFKTFDDIGLLYSIPIFLRWKIQKWQVVEIPFKDNIELWLVFDILDKKLWVIDESKIKSVISIYNEFIFLDKYRLKLLPWIANHYFSPIHNSHSLFFPKNLVWKIRNWKIKLESSKNYKYNFNHDIELSNNQEISYNKIVESKKNKILFYGLTWSWKTEIYIKLINDYIKKDKQVLFLIPEIILTNQLSEKIIKTFWEDVIVLNSTITDAKKTKYWIDINNNSSKIIIWTRSAIFYPYNNLWLIIVDEEHDNSYVSDSAPRYNTIEIANKLTELNSNKLVLASGTPSIASMYKWLKGQYEIINLLEKYKKK